MIIRRLESIAAFFDKFNAVASSKVLLNKSQFTCLFKNQYIYLHICWEGFCSANHRREQKNTPDYLILIPTTTNCKN